VLAREIALARALCEHRLCCLVRLLLALQLAFQIV
jgi:hypothetical protein